MTDNHVHLSNEELMLLCQYIEITKSYRRREIACLTVLKAEIENDGSGRYDGTKDLCDFWRNMNQKLEHISKKISEKISETG